MFCRAFCRVWTWSSLPVQDVSSPPPLNPLKENNAREKFAFLETGKEPSKVVRTRERSSSFFVIFIGLAAELRELNRAFAMDGRPNGVTSGEGNGGNDSRSNIERSNVEEIASRALRVITRLPSAVKRFSPDAVTATVPCLFYGFRVC